VLQGVLTDIRKPVVVTRGETSTKQASMLLRDDTGQAS
jgi:hypothetical protein